MAADRWLIAGLGNPGREYSHNRHNIGYWVINRLARLHRIPLRARSLAALGDGTIAGHDVVLLKPRTFVNHSGEAIGPVLKKWRITPEHLLVIYDELDLPAGRIRIKARGSHGGHRGLKSIIQAAGSSDFPRMRIGIGRPHVDGEPSWEPEDVADWVLSDPRAEETRTLQGAAARAAEAVELLLADGVEAAMSRYNH